VRKTQTKDGRVFTFTDTVGFVRHLPHQLVEAFKSTLEEVGESDLILHIVDGSHVDPFGQIAAVREVFAEIGVGEIPEIIVINKADLADPEMLNEITRREPHSIVVSARTGLGVEQLIEMVTQELPRPKVLVEATIPYSRGDLVNRVHMSGELLLEEHRENGTFIRARMSDALAKQIVEISIEANEELQ
jgi:GTP-binding protein HflX